MEDIEPEKNEESTIESLNHSTLYYHNKKMVDSYKIRTLNIKEDTKDFLNMNVILTSKTNSGKSVILKDICYDLKDRYHQVYVFSLTAYLQPDLFTFVPEENIINKFDESFLETIWKQQEKLVLRLKKSNTKEDNIPRTLIIYDDLISDPAVSKSPVLRKLFVMGRHAKISQMFLTQSFTAIPPILRKNCAIAIAFYLDSYTDREAYAKSYLSTQNIKQGIMLLEKITKEPYQAVCCLNCITSQDPEDTVRMYKARLKLPDFKMGTKESIIGTVHNKGTFLKIGAGTGALKTVDLCIRTVDD